MLQSGAVVSQPERVVRLRLWAGPRGVWGERHEAPGFSHGVAHQTLPKYLRLYRMNLNLRIFKISDLKI